MKKKKTKKNGFSSEVESNHRPRDGFSLFLKLQSPALLLSYQKLQWIVARLCLYKQQKKNNKKRDKKIQ